MTGHLSKKVWRRMVLLAYLHREGSWLTMTQLGLVFGLDHTTLSASLAELRFAGYVEREQTPRAHGNPLSTFRAIERVAA